MIEWAIAELADSEAPDALLNAAAGDAATAAELADVAGEVWLAAAGSLAAWYLGGDRLAELAAEDVAAGWAENMDGWLLWWIEEWLDPGAEGWADSHADRVHSWVGLLAHKWARKPAADAGELAELPAAS